MNQLIHTTPDPLDLTDEHLMAMIKARRTDFFEMLYDRHAPILKSVVMKVINNDAEADDLLQEIFMEIWNRADSYDEHKGRPLGWIITLARRRAIDRLRKCQSRCDTQNRFQVEQEQQPHAWIKDGDEDIHSADLRALLQQLLESLPVAQREALEMAYYKGMSQREIARQTGIPLGTIKTRIELGLKKITAAMKDYADEF